MQQNASDIQLNSLPWATVHPAVYRQGGRMVRWARGTVRPNGAIRYECPVTGSFILVTDEATLAHLNRPRARLRCAGCGEMHPLTMDEPSAPSA